MPRCCKYIDASTLMNSPHIFVAGVASRSSNSTGQPARANRQAAAPPASPPPAITTGLII
jgi:hypothetical protein